MMFHKRNEGEEIRYGFNYGYMSGDKNKYYNTFIIKAKWFNKSYLRMHFIVFIKSVSMGIGIYEQ